MKRKLLFAIVALLCSVGTWAGDVKRDVTSLLTNPTFDSDITGWTNEENVFKWNSNVGKSLPSFAEYWKQGDEGPKDVRSLSQTINNLPAGKYKLTARCIGGEEVEDRSDYLYATIGGLKVTADVHWIKNDSVVERTLNFSNPTKQSVEIGFTVNGTKWWSAIDDVKLYAMDLASASDDLPNTAVDTGTWYKFTTGSSSDAYILSSNGDATITYTTDGTITDDSGISTTWTLTAKQNVLLAPSTTYYIKSNATVTLTKTESTVSSSCVTGWTKVTSLSELQTNPEDYFFAIYSANNTELMVETKSNGVPYYLTATSPSSTYYLYEIGNYTYNAEPYFVMKSCGTSGYFYPVDEKAYDLQAPSSKSVADDACRLTFEVANNGIWNIKTWADWDNGSYLGLWTPSNGYANGQNMAGNKTDAAKGSFLIYRIAKSNINLTGNITNPGFENATWSTGWTGTGEDIAQAFVKQSNNSSFSGNFAEMWVRSTTMSAGNIYQTLSKLPAGVYTLSAKVQASIPSKLYARIDAEEQYIECNSSVKTETLTFLVSETSDVTIGLKHDGVASASGDVWIAVDDFALTYVEPLADSDDYDALNLAIEAANAKTLGFEVGEYAPYNNVDAISKLASAKAINQSAVNAKSTITSATTALASATWTANDGKVNAVYNGDFALSENNGAMAGWVTDHSAGLGGEYHARAFVLNSGDGNYDYLAAFGQGDGTRSCAYFRFDGTNSAKATKYTYGSTTGYTMPLKTGTIYKLTAQAGGWGQVGRAFKMDVVNSSDASLVAQTLTTPATGVNAGGPVIDYEMYFVVPANGNYKLVLNNTSGVDNAVAVSNIELFSTDALILAENTTYAAGTYPTVTLDRTFASTDRWYTLCAPFAFSNSKDKFAEVKVLNEVVGEGESAHMKFVNAGATVDAGTPCLVKPASANATLTATGVAMNPATTAQTVTVDGINFIGTFSRVDLTSANSNAWVVSNNNLYNVDSDVTVGAYRAYFTVTSSPVKALSFDFGDATGIGSITNGQQPMANGPIYNLAGQKMSKLQKGVNIVNGKKVLVK